MSSATDIRNRLKQKPRLTREVVIDGETFLVRSLSELEHSAANAACWGKSKFDQARYYRELIVRSVVTPDGELVFKPEEQAELTSLQQYVVQPLIEAINLLNSYGDVGKLPKSSSETDD